MNNETGPPVAAYPGQYQGYDPSIDPERFNNKANASCRFDIAIYVQIRTDFIF